MAQAWLSPQNVAWSLVGFADPIHVKEGVTVGLSKDPDGRARQLANLKRGKNPAPKGNARGLRHGADTQRPHGGPEWSPAVQAAVADLEGRVGSELRNDAGEIHAWAVPSIEAVAIQRVASWRMDRWTADREAKGKATPEDFDRQSRIGERYHRALEREALTLRSRIETRGQAQSLTAWLAEDDEQEAGRG